jgi:signal transduction histidine kinase/ActR/RegA family two-component response regulator
VKQLGRSLSNYWGDLPVRTKGLVVIALPLFAFVSSTLLILGARKMNTDATSWVRHSQEVRVEIRDFRELLLEAEDYARGYGLRDGQDWSKISQQTRTTLLGKAASLTALVKDDPEQTGRINRVTALLSDQLTALDGVRRTQGAEASMQQFLSLEKKAGDGMRRQLGAMQETELQLLEKRRVTLVRSGTIMLYTLYGSLGIGCLASILGMLLFSKGISKRVQALEQNAYRLRDGLALPDESHPDDEIGRVARALVQSSALIAENSARLQEAKEHSERSDRAKSEFLSRMSHELRTPMNSILGFAQVLQMGGGLPARALECVDHILKGGRHLLRLIDEVLDIARIESGRLPLSVEPVLVSEAISQTLEMVRPIAESRGIQLSSDTSRQCQQHVMADRQRLHQVLLNLLSNAIKYNQPNGSVHISCQAENKNAVRIKVEDTGFGIASQDQARLFAPFERLAAPQTDVEGTGLGLALSKQLVQAMGGGIGLVSQIGKGSTFWVELPGAEAPVERVRRQDVLTAQPPDPVPQSLKVLYIEDNVANVQLIEHVLTFRSHVKLLTAMQGRLGLELAVENRPDLILLDLHLPDLRGDLVLHDLRTDSRTRDIPTIMISADATPGEIRRLREAGATDYLTKPLDVEKLLHILDEHLRRNSENFEQVPVGGA